MNSEKKIYTFYWYIENYSCCWHENGNLLKSPSFTVGKLENTTWTLQLYPRGIDSEEEGYVSLFLARAEDDEGPRSITLDFELLVLKADGSVFCDSDNHYEFKKGDGYGSGDFLSIDEILRRNSEYLPNDILCLCCKMRKGSGNVYNIGQTLARTRIRVKKNSFIQAVGNFSRLHQNTMHRKIIISPLIKGYLMTSFLYFTGPNVMIDVNDIEQTLCNCEFSVLDASGNVIKCGEIDNRYAARKCLYTLPLTLTKKEILDRKTEYLPDDKLSLICKFTFSSGIEFETIEETIDEMPLAVIEKQTSNVPKKTDNTATETLSTSLGVSENVNVPCKNICKDSEKLSTYPSALEDMKALYINQCLTDIQVKTKTKSFPAHKSVLCARSPVFQAMMTNEMKEKITDCIHIDDIEDNAVQQLLLFLYSDNIEDLHWNSATQLYYAADKYQIGRLKVLCASFLLENINSINAGELLLLADTHSDGDLKKSVEDFILKHDEEIFVSKEWETLMESNPLLVMKTMQLKYMRKKGIK